jgi:glyoxylase-like metal-dependent hydrolase (beta-lactamase superfamily II)
VNELKPGLWYWQAPHPDWSPRERWPELVSSYAIDDGSRLLLFDPQAVPEPLLELAAEREPVVVLTTPWHERDASFLHERLGAPVFTPPADTAEDLVRKFGITIEQAGDGSPDLAWMKSAGPGTAHFYAAGDRLPIGVDAHPGKEHNDLVLWIEGAGALIPGDTLVDFGEGFGINKHLRGGVTRDQVATILRPLLDLPIELVLPTHGAPAGKDALERALA